MRLFQRVYMRKIRKQGGVECQYALLVNGKNVATGGASRLDNVVLKHMRPGDFYQEIESPHIGPLISYENLKESSASINYWIRTGKRPKGR